MMVKHLFGFALYITFCHIFVIFCLVIAPLIEVPSTLLSELLLADVTKAMVSQAFDDFITCTESIGMYGYQSGKSVSVCTTFTIIGKSWADANVACGQNLCVADKCKWLTTQMTLLAFIVLLANRAKEPLSLLCLPILQKHCQSL